MFLNPDSKNLGGRPATGRGTPVMVRLQPQQLESLDVWISSQAEPRPTRPEAVRRILGEHLGSAASSLGLISEQIEAQKSKIDSLPAPEHQASPEAGMNAMRRALAENDFVDMKNARRRTKKRLQE